MLDRFHYAHGFPGDIFSPLLDLAPHFIPMMIL